MALSESKKKSNKKWNDENLNKIYDHVHLVLPKGEKEKIKAHAEKNGESLNGYINRLIEQDMNTPGG